MELPLLISVGSLGIAALAFVISLSRWIREIRATPEVFWFITASETQRDRWVVRVKPSREVFAVDMQVLGNGAYWPPGALKVVRPEHTIEIVVETADIGAMWLLMSWSSLDAPRINHLEWAAVTSDGPAHVEAERQVARPHWWGWFLASFLQVPVGPRGVRWRRAGWRDTQRLRRSLRRKGVRPWPDKDQMPAEEVL